MNPIDQNAQSARPEGAQPPEAAPIDFQRWGAEIDGFISEVSAELSDICQSLDSQSIDTETSQQQAPNHVDRMSSIKNRLAELNQQQNSPLPSDHA